MTKSWPRAVLLFVLPLPFCAAAALPARADNNSAQLQAIERQISQLQNELKAVKHQLKAENEAAKIAQAKAAHTQSANDHLSAAAGMPVIPPGYALVPAAPGATPGSVVLEQTENAPEPLLPQGTFRVGGLKIALSGWFEAAGIYRTRNEVADIGSNFNTGIPLPNSPNYHQGEFRESERQSRFRAIITGEPDPVTKIRAYVETDFLGAASTSNSTQTDSYTPRVRQLFATYDRSDWGFEFLGGQAYSLLTMNLVGVDAAQIMKPLVIDSQNVVGYTYARQPQIRVVKSFDNNHLFLAASLENPQTVYYTGPNGAAPSSLGTVNTSNPGGSGYASSVNYSDDQFPDSVVKGVAEFGPVHFEAYGVARFMHDRVSTLGNGSNNDVTTGAGGAGVYVHVIPTYLEFLAQVLSGKGIGRYGPAQLPDATVNREGSPDPIPETMAWTGLIAHPSPAWDVYGYGGIEEESARYFDEKKKAYGYGNPLYPNTSCDTELGSSSNCTANTSRVAEGTAGFWYKFVQGPYGTMQTGIQYSYFERSIFSGVGTTPKPNENMLMLSFRYYPFQ